MLDLEAMIQTAERFAAAQRESDEQFNTASANDHCPQCGHTMRAHFGDLYLCRHRFEFLKGMCEAQDAQSAPPSPWSILGVRITVESTKETRDTKENP